jgi:hypothetical protein
MTKTKRCPKCKSESFGQSSNEPVTIGGWYGNIRFGWQEISGVRVVRETAIRCDCGFVKIIK